MSEQYTPLQKAVFTGGLIIGFAAFVKLAHDFHKHYKVEKITEEYLERITHFEGAKDRLRAILQDPEKTHDDFLDAVAEERKFYQQVCSE